MISGRNAPEQPEARQSPARGRAGTGRVPIILFMVVYVAVILYSPRLFPLDDHRFLQTIQVGKNLPFYVIPEIGRFHPLTAQEYNLLSRIDTSPALYFAFNAFQFVAIGWAFIRLMSDGGAHTSSSVPWLFVLFSLSPGFVSAWFRFQVSERGALFFFVLFLVCYRGIQRTPNAWWFVSAVAAANLALYYKEPGFLMLATFAILRLASQWRGQPRITAGLDSWLLVSCFIFVVAYIALVHVHKRDLDYADFHTRAFGETLLAYVINDPLLVLGAVSLAVVRLVVVGRRRSAWDPLYEPALLASVVYVACYLTLRIFSPWYLLPAYAFALPAMVRFIAVGSGWLRWAATMVVGLQLVAGLPLGLHLIAYNKGLPEAYAATVDFLTTELARMPAGARPGIFLVGVGRGGFVEIYVSLAENLKFKGVSSERFDLKSDLPIDNPHIFAHLRSSLDAYSAYRDETPERPRKGDYLIVTPWASLPREHLESLSERFDPVFRTKGSLALPDLSLTRPLNALSWDGVMGFLHQLRRPTWSQSEFVVYSVPVQCNGPVTITEPAPLSDFAQRLELRSRPVERSLKPRQHIRLALRVSNPGTQPWPVTTTITSGRWVHLSYHWVNEAGADVIEGARQVLPCGLRPQEETATGLTVAAPGQPGRYRLRLSLVQEGVAWFDQRGGRPLELEFDVVR